MCIDNLDNIKRSINKENKAIKLAKHIKLLSELGEPAENFRIIDRKEMSYNDIQDYSLAIKTGVPGIRPKKSQIVSRPTFGDKYEIRYNYDLREELSGPKLLDTSRDFCVHIIDANKMYLRQDIDKMSNGFELSVFEYSGGFWNNDGVIEPKCRHSWFLNFVERLK
jgi:hypothetical protein